MSKIRNTFISLGKGIRRKGYFGLPMTDAQKKERARIRRESAKRAAKKAGKYLREGHQRAQRRFRE